MDEVLKSLKMQIKSTRKLIAIIYVVIYICKENK